MHIKRGHLRAVTEVQSAERDNVGGEPDEVPDVSMPHEALYWRSPIRAGVQIDIAGVEPRFLDTRLTRLRAGIEGRGFATIAESVLTVEIGVTSKEAASTWFLDTYSDTLIAYLNLSRSALMDRRIVEFEFTAEAEVDANDIIRKYLGLRGLSNI